MIAEDPARQQEGIEDNPRGWYTYMVRCADHTLYTGITTDPARRTADHNQGPAGARYTRSRRPVKLVWAEEQPTRAAAARREYQVRRLPVAAKEALIAGGGIPL